MENVAKEDNVLTVTIPINPKVIRELTDESVPAFVESVGHLVLAEAQRQLAESKEDA